MASERGVRTAPRIADRIGAVSTSGDSNEFLLDGEPIAIKTAHGRCRQIGMTKGVLSRIRFVYAGFEAGKNTFDLYRIDRASYERHARKRSGSHSGEWHLKKGQFERHGEHVGVVCTSVPTTVL